MGVFLAGIGVYFYRKIQTAKRLGFAVAKRPYDIQVNWADETIKWKHTITVTNGDVLGVSIQAINLQVFTPYDNGKQMQYVGNAILTEPVKITAQASTRIVVQIITGIDDLGLSIWRIITGLVSNRSIEMQMKGEIKAEGVFINFDQKQIIDFSNLGG